jgi:hypothetical protein
MVPLVFFWQNLLQEEEKGGFFLRVLAAWGPKHPLTSSVRRWFRLFNCNTFFLALHTSARNHATRFSMFFKKKAKKLSNTALLQKSFFFWEINK